MNKEAVQRLREPAAWLLLAAAGLHLLAGLISLLGGGGSFTARALGETQGGTFLQIVLVGALALAVLLVTWGEKQTGFHARPPSAGAQDTEYLKEQRAQIERFRRELGFLEKQRALR